MTTNNSGTRQPQHDLTAELNFLSRALKAPTLRDAAGRLTERAREESWTHEEFLVACLQREVSARESHGGESRIRAARFPARKSLEEFDFDHARGLQRDAIAHLNTWHGRPPRPAQRRRRAAGPAADGAVHRARPGPDRRPRCRRCSRMGRHPRSPRAGAVRASRFQRPLVGAVLRPGPPEYRKASCIHTAESCSNITSCSACTTTSGRETASSGTPPLIG